MLVGMELQKLLLLVVLLALETLPLIRFFIYFPTLGLLTSTTKAIIWIWNIWLNGWITIKKARSVWQLEMHVELACLAMLVVARLLAWPSFGFVRWER